jgi:hypothetical protein
MHLITYLDFLRQTEEALADSYRLVSGGYADDADVHYATARFAARCSAHASSLVPVLAGFGTATDPRTDRLHVHALVAPRTGPLGLLRDLQDLYQLAHLVDITWTLVDQAARGSRNSELLRVSEQAAPEITAQLAWLRTRMKADAPQTLLVSG